MKALYFLLLIALAAVPASLHREEHRVLDSTRHYATTMVCEGGYCSNTRLLIRH
ncbi:MAG: hypothetical protein KDI44_17370 [Thiothrix sp.]|nr:hypothetical protein [Thiothrix sp.]HPQ94290.1 hypothetical protein [Thiolinea sp.]